MEDYESVLGGAYLHGAVVVVKDLEGIVEIQQTDQVVRKGAAGLAVVGSSSACSHHRCLPRWLADPAIGPIIVLVVGDSSPRAMTVRSWGRCRMGRSRMRP